MQGKPKEWSQGAVITEWKKWVASISGKQNDQIVREFEHAISNLNFGDAIHILLYIRELRRGGILSLRQPHVQGKSLLTYKAIELLSRRLDSEAVKNLYTNFISE